MRSLTKQEIAEAMERKGPPRPLVLSRALAMASRWITARAWLCRYGRHRMTCATIDMNHRDYPTCTCGLYALLADLDAKEQP